MKNNRKNTIAFLGSILLLASSCQQGPKKDDTTDPRTPGEPQEEVVSAPSGIITLAESKSLYDNYTKNRVDMIQQFEMERKPDEKFVPARFSDFDYATIKQYIAFIEQEAKEAKVDISTLRIYFANYPDKDRFPDGDKVVHPRQNSIFIVPTMRVDSMDYGFYIGADGKAKLIKNAVGETGIGYKSNQVERSEAGFVPSLSSTSIDQSLNLNHGSSGPPPYPDDFD
ncbi:MAG: hypothetical protein DSY83_13955 [Flavobacteriia bacterium]|nr:MAG: hypothetical protein DSY83_13955 [Flavobacteriia bacterium]